MYSGNAVSGQTMKSAGPCSLSPCRLNRVKRPKTTSRKMAAGFGLEFFLVFDIGLHH